jgi:hypothetical protein
MRCALLFALAAALAVAPAAMAQKAVPDSTVRALVAALHNCEELADEDWLRLLRVVAEDPDRIQSLGLPLPALGRCPPQNVVRRADVARAFAARALDRLSRGDETLGDTLFAAALDLAVSDRQRADFLSARAEAGLGDVRELTDRAVALVPWHAQSLYRRAGLLADAIGRPMSLEGRMAYWCLADEYRRVAALSDDERVAEQARAAADRYEARAPNLQSAAILDGPKPGQTITVPLVDGAACTTVVR